ncbi:AAA family ATPase, partial [Thomasclavelia sp.]|uniref:AAA family ATPase n=1 Tax=Thomasclavelia sp. TaxID=3025757 RepID=UPI0026012549
MSIYKKVENKLTEIKNKVLSIKDSEDIENEKINHLKQNISNKINVIEKKFNNELGNFDNSEITINFKELINNLLSKIFSISLPNNLSNLYDTDKQLSSIILEIDKVEILTILSSVKNTVVIVGANGAGKSSFVSELKKTTLPNLCVLPAQKYLIFNKNAFRRDKSTIESYQQSMHENYIDIARNISEEHIINQYFSYTFTFLITSLIKEYSEIATRKMRNEEDYRDKTPIWEQLEEIWNQLIPNITFEIDPNEREVYAHKKGNRYGLNGLSDGEKCIIFYIGNVLTAPENSYIVVDEPETFLNPSIYNKLWDSLILKRQDCQFIFTSHTMDFVNSRTNCRYI